MTRITAEIRKQIILGYYERFHQLKYLEWDPLSVVREHLDSENAEYIALVSALFAFGGVKQIIASVRAATERLGLSTEVSILNLNRDELIQKLHGFTHRIYVGNDLVALTLLYQKSVSQHGSLGAHFLSHHSESQETIQAGLCGVIKDYKEWYSQVDFEAGAHFKHMLNSPEQGSTCKRWLMFLKWMIRADDGIDLGLWAKHKEMKPGQLLIPLDTHLFKISKKLGLTHKKTANWKTSIEVTRALKKIDPLDPTRFDFSLCRFGMFDYRKLLEKV